MGAHGSSTLISFICEVSYPLVRCCSFLTRYPNNMQDAILRILIVARMAPVSVIEIGLNIKFCLARWWDFPCFG